MKLFGTNEAAADLGVDPRMLRRWLRNNSRWENAGMGGRYIFSETEMIDLRRAFKKSKLPAPDDHDPHFLDDDPGLDLGAWTSALGDHRAMAKLRRRRQAARAARQQRLIIRIQTVLPERFKVSDPDE